MIFSEIYGAYFQAVAAVLKEAVKGTLDERKARRIVQRIAYVESSPVIIDALKTKEWPLVDSEWGTNLEHEPTRPLTSFSGRSCASGRFAMKLSRYTSPKNVA